MSEVLQFMTIQHLATSNYPGIEPALLVTAVRSAVRHSEIPIECSVITQSSDS
jgi:hypothetical protein